MHNQRVRRAIVLAVAGVLLAAAAVFADTIKADGDVLTTSVDNFVELGQVTPGTVIHVDVAFQLDCGGSKHLDANQSVTLTLGSRTVPLGGDASATSAVINPPGSSWPVDGIGCPLFQSPLRSATNSHVTITAPMTLGVGKLYTLNYLRTISPSNPNDTGTFSGSTNVSFSLDVVPNTPPVLSLPNNMTVEGSAPGGATVTYTAGATDVEDNPDPSPVCTPASGSFFSLGGTTVNCTVTDSAGATATGSFRVTVADTTPPTMSPMPADLSLVTNDPAGAAISYTPPTATDAVDPNASVSCTPASGSVVPVGYTEISCTASDASGNSVTKHFGVGVHLNAAPLLSLPANMTVQGDAPGGSTVLFVASATDAEDQTAPEPTCSAASPSFFNLGATTVNCEVTDSGGLTAKGSFTVTVIDTVAPTMSTVADVSAFTNDPAGGKISYSLPSVSDVVDAKPSVSCSPASGSVVRVGDSIGTCTATDASGNSTSNTFAINVHLNTAPVLVVPANISVEGNATGGARVTFAVSATDAEDNPDPTPSCSRASGSPFAVGTTTVTCEVTDSDGQTVSRSFSVKVNDTTSPTLSGGTGGLSLTTSNPAGAAISYTAPSADDIVDASPSVSCSPASGSVAPVGDTFVNCTATDASGNTATSRFPVQVVLLSSETWSASWEEPIGPPAQVTANGGRTLPVKLRIYRNGVEVTTGSALMRLVPCVAGGTTVELPLAFGGRWTGKIDTSMLAGDCFRVAVIAGGTEAGSFRLDLTGATPVKAPNKGPTATKAPAKTAKP
jgi:HYR domain-containing protein